MFACSVVYWTDWGSSPAIMLARMDGEIVGPIIDTNIMWPNGVAVDYETDLIYWTDAFYHHIERADLNGDERTVIFSYSSDVLSLYHGFHVLVKDHHAYWSDWLTSSVYSAHLPNGNDSSQIPRELKVIDRATVRYFGFTIVNTSSPRQGGTYYHLKCLKFMNQCTCVRGYSSRLVCLSVCLSCSDFGDY